MGRAVMGLFFEYEYITCADGRCFHCLIALDVMQATIIMTGKYIIYFADVTTEIIDFVRDLRDNGNLMAVVGLAATDTVRTEPPSGSIGGALR
jgi:hypothetical protein